MFKYPVPNSTNIALIEYDEKTKQMGVTFRNGRKYLYANVEEGLVRKFVSAPSKGQFFNQTIKPSIKPLGSQ